MRLSIKPDGSARTLFVPEHILDEIIGSQVVMSCEYQDIHSQQCSSYQDRQKFIMLSSISCPGAIELTELPSIMIEDAMSFLPYAASSDGIRSVPRGSA